MGIRESRHISYIFFCLQCSSDSTSNISLFIATVPESVMSWPLVRPSLDDLLRELLDMHLGAAGGMNDKQIDCGIFFGKKSKFSKQLQKTVHAGLNFEQMTMRHRGIISALRRSLAVEVEVRQCEIGWIPVTFVILLCLELKLDYI